ncbi:FHA domain-containing protein [Streptomyces sp. C11-1]|uniref:FHA domain-containing protein n=1 Tax=Streptomyces durocortorensis TaxID=2811104 RepID=A0ABY9VV66_9ACTN|nr:FHA domain-containing protein [Streptomyces durocortorensis]WNF27488.1 FHA domain-containing protein [Streptomyces durocortorensis]
MYTIIVVPGPGMNPGEQLRLAPGETLRFGRKASTGPSPRLTIPHDGVSRSAGEITATDTYWSLSNFSRTATYAVENPEGAGEHIKVAPRRLGAPVAFEFSRVVLPAGTELLSFDVWAPRHDYAAVTADGSDRDEPAEDCGGESTALAFPLDRSKRYFIVLAALCESRLSGEPYAPVPTVEQVVERLRPQWPAANRAAVQWNIDYLAVKLRLKPGPESCEPGPRLNGKKETLVSLALRFDLVREDDLAALAPSTSGAAR